MPLKKSLLILVGFIAAVALLAYKINPDLFAPKGLGSFEYVRKGEALLDKGRYKESIGYFEKARSSSPDSREIKLGLIYAYSRYGEALGASADYNTAIENLKKAYGIISNTYTIQNLAFAYSKRALEEARGGNWAKVIEDLTRAADIVSNSAVAGKNLAISLFNDAVGEYKAGREKIAMLFLRGASLLREESFIFEFMGDIYYKRADLAMAFFYWDRAKSLDQENKGLAEKLEKLAKEIEVAKSEESVASPHFDIRYGKDSKIDTGLVKKVLEEAYFDVGRDLSYFPDSKTAIFLYSESDFRNIFKLPNIVRAFYDGNIRMPLPKGELALEEVNRYIRHEYTHAVVSAMTNNNCPVWLSEGIATWEDFKNNHPAARDAISKIALDSQMLSLPALEKAFTSGEMRADIGAYYLLSYTVVKYIIDTWGMGGLKDILKRLAYGQHIVNALDDEFLLSEKEFERRWMDYIKEKYS